MPPSPSDRVYDDYVYAYDQGYADGWDWNISGRRPAPTYSPIQRVCYRAGWADGHEDRCEGEKAGDKAYLDVSRPWQGDDDECEEVANAAATAAIGGHYRRSYDAPWGW